MTTTTFRVDPFATNPAGRRVLPSFSLAERDRRYGLVRKHMAERGLDCLMVPYLEVPEAQANARYLTQIGGVGLSGGVWVIFPLDGEVTAILPTERAMLIWKDTLEWPTDLRWGDFVELVPERMNELGLGNARIGVIGQNDQQGRSDGIVRWNTWDKVVEALPGATFSIANDVVDRARVVKGPEEVAVVQRIAEADEAAIARMIEVARPGVEEGAVWMEMADVMMRHTADFPARLSLGSNGRQANAGNGMALPITLEDGGIMSQEIEARLQGYRAQCNHSILVGSKNAGAYTEAMNAAISVFNGLVDWMKPGRTVQEFLKEYVRLADEAGGDVRGVVMHSCGLENTRPRLGPDVAETQDWVIEPGWTFTIKTSVRMRSTRAYAQVGEPLTVEEGGARKLGRRKLEPVITGP